MALFDKNKKHTKINDGEELRMLVASEANESNKKILWHSYDKVYGNTLTPRGVGLSIKGILGTDNNYGPCSLSIPNEDGDWLGTCSANRPAIINFEPSNIYTKETSKNTDKIVRLVYPSYNISYSSPVYSPTNLYLCDELNEFSGIAKKYGLGAGFIILTDKDKKDFTEKDIHIQGESSSINDECAGLSFAKKHPILRINTTSKEVTINTKDGKFAGDNGDIIAMIRISSNVPERYKTGNVYWHFHLGSIIGTQNYGLILNTYSTNYYNNSDRYNSQCWVYPSNSSDNTSGENAASFVPDCDKWYELYFDKNEINSTIEGWGDSSSLYKVRCFKLREASQSNINKWCKEGTGVFKTYGDVKYSTDKIDYEFKVNAPGFTNNDTVKISLNTANNLGTTIKTTKESYSTPLTISTQQKNYKYEFKPTKSCVLDLDVNSDNPRTFDNNNPINVVYYSGCTFIYNINLKLQATSSVITDFSDGLYAYMIDVDNDKTYSLGKLSASGFLDVNSSLGDRALISGKYRFIISGGQNGFAYSGTVEEYFNSDKTITIALESGIALISTQSPNFYVGVQFNQPLDIDTTGYLYKTNNYLEDSFSYNNRIQNLFYNYSSVGKKYAGYVTKDRVSSDNSNRPEINNEYFDEIYSIRWKYCVSKGVTACKLQIYNYNSETFGTFLLGLIHNKYVGNNLVLDNNKDNLLVSYVYSFDDVTSDFANIVRNEDETYTIDSKTYIKSNDSEQSGSVLIADKYVNNNDIIYIVNRPEINKSSSSSINLKYRNDLGCYYFSNNTKTTVDSFYKELYKVNNYNNINLQLIFLDDSLTKFPAEGYIYWTSEGYVCFDKVQNNSFIPDLTLYKLNIHSTVNLSTIINKYITNEIKSKDRLKEFCNFYYDLKRYSPFIVSTNNGTYDFYGANLQTLINKFNEYSYIKNDEYLKPIFENINNNIGGIDLTTTSTGNVSDIDTNTNFGRLYEILKSTASTLAAGTNTNELRAGEIINKCYKILKESENLRRLLNLDSVSYQLKINYCEFEYDELLKMWTFKTLDSK